jgi:hypothetical protein
MMGDSQSPSQRKVAAAGIVIRPGPALISSRCSDALQLDLARSSIKSQDLGQTQQPQRYVRNGNVATPSCASSYGYCNSNRMLPTKSEINVGILMRPETGAWANQSSDFSQPMKPLGLHKNQAPLITAPQDAFRNAVRTKHLRNLGITQALVMGVHDIPFTSVPAINAPTSIMPPKGRKRFPDLSESSFVRDCLSKNGRSPIPSMHASAISFCMGDRPHPAAASFLFPEGCIPCVIAEELKHEETSPRDSSRRRHTPNKKDRRCVSWWFNNCGPRHGV